MPLVAGLAQASTQTVPDAAVSHMLQLQRLVPVQSEHCCAGCDTGAKPDIQQHSNGIPKLRDIVIEC